MKLPAVPSEGFLAALPEEERRKLGRAGITREEAEATYKRGQEIQLQRLITNYLNLNEIYYEWDRTDKRTSGKRGRPDFRCCVKGLWLALECKAEGETLSKEQAIEALRLRKSGGKFVVVFSLKDAIEAIADVRNLL